MASSHEIEIIRRQRADIVIPVLDPCRALETQAFPKII